MLSSFSSSTGLLHQMQQFLEKKGRNISQTVHVNWLVGREGATAPRLTFGKVAKCEVTHRFPQGEEKLREVLTL